jgi:hypothetical protein
MRKSKYEHYLLLLRNHSKETASLATRLARSMNISVPVRYGDLAIEVVAPAEKVEALYSQGLFITMVKGAVSRDHLQKYSMESQRLLELWNSRHSNRFIKSKEDLTNYGKSWGDEHVKPPAPYTKINVGRFKELLEDLLKRQKLKTRIDKDLIRKFEAHIEKHVKTKELAHHLKNLKYYLPHKYMVAIIDLPWSSILQLVDTITAADEYSCWKMSGSVSVGIVFVESSVSGGPKFGDNERDDIWNEIVDGLGFLTDEHPTNNLTWVIDTQFTRINVPNDQTVDENAAVSLIEPHWRDPGMAQVNYNGKTYTGDPDGVLAYKEDMKLENHSDYSFVIFVTPYRNNWFAYNGDTGIVLAKHDNWGKWGRSVLDRITAHETSHVFGSDDEYAGSGTPCESCDTVSGCDQIPNGNCGLCAAPHLPCIMAENQHRICQYTRGQIGWSDIFVELFTDNDLWSGTNDDVWLDIGDRIYTLDTKNHDDRERGNREGYAIWDKDIQLSDIKRILIRKSKEGSAGGWKLKRVRVFFRGEPICDESPHVWLKDDHRWFLACVFDNSLINKLEIQISTADVSYAGTDDDVTLTLAGRSWNLDTKGHNDFERGNTDSFRLDPQTSFYPSDIHSIRIHKSPDGLAGGWKLKGITLNVNDATIFNNQNINKWLEDDHRNWEGYI